MIGRTNAGVEQGGYKPIKPKRLPTGYTELTYIESTGTQYIDTEIKPTNNTELFIDYEVSKMTTDESLGSFPFGTRVSWLNQMYTILECVNSDRTTRYIWGDTNSTMHSGSREGIRTKIKVQKNVWSSNELGNYTFSNKTFTCSHNLYLFNDNDAGTALVTDAHIRIYSFYMKEGASEINLVPCINPLGEVGMYDMVTATFFGNDGTGEFIAGDVQQYQVLTYLQGSGTQYIDAEIKVNSNLNFEFEFEPIGTQTNAWRGFFGSRDSASSTNNITAWWESNTMNFCLSYSSSDIVFKTTIAQQNKYFVEKHGDNFFVNNELVASEHRTISDGTRNIYVFKNNTGDGDYSGAPMKLYSACFYDGTTKVREFIPALSADGNLGLYDKVTSRLFTNQGTGTFIGGELVA